MGEKCPFHELGWAEIGGWVGALVAVAVGALLAGVFLRGTRTKGVEKRRRKPAVGGSDGSVVGEGTGLDCIVVGAGVAGSALAYTLGKVIPVSPPFASKSLLPLFLEIESISSAM
jgi:hypothetical protein